MTIDVAEARALEQVRAKALQLQKPSLFTNSMANKSRSSSVMLDSFGSVTGSDPWDDEPAHNDETMHVETPPSE